MMSSILVAPQSGMQSSSQQHNQSSRSQQEVERAEQVVSEDYGPFSMLPEDIVSSETSDQKTFEPKTLNQSAAFAVSSSSFMHHHQATHHGAHHSMQGAHHSMQGAHHSMHGAHQSMCGGGGSILASSIYNSNAQTVEQVTAEMSFNALYLHALHKKHIEVGRQPTTDTSAVSPLMWQTTESTDSIERPPHL